MTGANLTNVDLTESTLTGADLRNATFLVKNVQTVTFDSTTVYNQWTVFPEDFDPAAAGLTLVLSPTGDFGADDVLDGADIDSLAARIRNGFAQPPWLRDAMFDGNGDNVVNGEDHRFWVKNLAHTWYGDANLDGEFNTVDFVQVFWSGKYEQRWLDEWGEIRGEHAGWSEGDWNGDGVFDTLDFVIAFQDGGYELGMMADVAAVPEPSAALLLILGVLCSVCRYRVST